MRGHERGEVVQGLRGAQPISRNAGAQDIYGVVIATPDSMARRISIAAAPVQGRNNLLREKREAIRS